MCMVCEDLRRLQESRVDFPRCPHVTTLHTSMKINGHQSATMNLGCKMSLAVLLLSFFARASNISGSLLCVQWEPFCSL